MNIADRFLAAFGPDAFTISEPHAMAALEWLASHDPDGLGQLVDGAISYHFSDNSRLVFDLETRRFGKPQ